MLYVFNHTEWCVLGFPPLKMEQGFLMHIWIVTEIQPPTCALQNNADQDLINWLKQLRVDADAIERVG